MNPDRKTRYSELDGIKGLLCIIIFCYHYFTRVCGSKIETSPSLVPLLFLKYGNLAVEFFFCISGFLSALSYRNRQMKFNEYIKRRMKIYPQIFIATMLCVILAVFDNVIFATNTLNLELTIQNLLRSILLISIPIEKKAPLSGQLWFYQVLVICFILYFFINKLDDYYILANISIAFCGYSFIVTKSTFILHQVMIGRGLLAFSIGVLLYEFINVIIPQYYYYLLLILSLGVIYLLGRYDETYVGNRFTVFGLFVAPAFIISVLKIKVLRSIFASWPMRILGRISLPFYLLHQNIIDAFRLFNKRYKLRLIFASNKVFALVLLVSMISSFLFLTVINIRKENKLKREA